MKTYYGIIELYGNSGEAFFATNEFEREECPDDVQCSNGKFDVYIEWYDIEEKRDEAKENVVAEGGKRIEWFRAAHVYSGEKEGAANA
ncbi:MAG: hypothetical protein RSG23_08720 [Gordonibacter sp.]|uniref:hypothetical protein n=1 Tax=Gordonibacter sp. TaxID=1968902 RepID=UPI002FC60716